MTELWMIFCHVLSCVIFCHHFQLKHVQILPQTKHCLPDLTLPWENRMMNIKNFHRAIQSNNAIFAGFKHVKIWRGFLLICLFKWQQIYLGLICKGNLNKILIFRSSILTLSKIIFTSSWTCNCTQKIFMGAFYAWKCLNSI